MVIPALMLFVFIEVIQSWFLLTEKQINKGIRAIILTEILELPLELYLILRGGTLIILIAIAVMILQWLAVAMLFNFLK